MWRIDQTQASLSASGLSARVNLQQPDLGIADLVWQGTPVAGARLLQVRRPRSDAGQHLVDAYVRGTDLIAVYETRLSGAVATQLYWRYVEHADLCLAGFELIVSVQTELLDDDPALALVSELPCSELFQAAKGDATSFARVPVPETRGEWALPLHRRGTLSISASANCPAAIWKWCTLRTSIMWNSSRDRIPISCVRGSSCSRNGWKKA